LLLKELEDRDGVDFFFKKNCPVWTPADLRGALISTLALTRKASGLILFKKMNKL